jgi:DNA repair protein RadA/Sms
VAPVKLAEVMSSPPKRLSSHIEEFDRVLGGGFVPGQVVLLAGEPGIGKSTLLTDIAQSMQEDTILYVCGEESVEQVKVRAIRMKYKASNLLMLPEINLDVILTAVESDKSIKLVIVDSIQTLYSEAFTGLAGSITQIKGCTQLLTNAVKKLGIPVVLIGHVTKEGEVAGPKVLEHIVDTVLYLEGDSQHLFRILRTTKNRFGPVSEVGIFEMAESGMREVKNPSELFLQQRLSSASGSCVTVVMEGYRPILFEVQALTAKTSFGYPRRTTTGFNVNRLQVLIAILEKRCGLNLSTFDVYVSIAGGFKVTEYAVDLAVCLAIASSVKDKPIKEGTVAFGECGLNGEIRKIANQEKRVREAKKLGYINVISPDTIKTLTQAVQQAF